MAMAPNLARPPIFASALIVVSSSCPFRAYAGHRAAGHAAEVPVRDAAPHFPLELLVAPALEVLEHQQPQHPARVLSALAAPDARTPKTDNVRALLTPHRSSRPLTKGEDEPEGW